MFNDTLAFDDVLLVPQKSDIESRSEIDIRSTIGGIEFQLPIISSPMDTVTEHEMATTMADLGGLGIIHRYNTIDEQCGLVSKCDPATVAAAVGVTGDYKDRTKALVDAGSALICIDVAHGHHTNVERAIKELKDYGKYSILFMSPELLVNSWRNLFSFHEKRVVGLIVDEAHCVVKW